MEDNNQQDVISLRGIIESVLKNKKLIVLIAVIVLALTFVYTFLIADEVYEAKTTIQVNQGEVNNTTIPSDVTDILDNMSLYSYSTIESYKEQILSQEVMMGVISELSLEDITVEGLADKISINNTEGSNLIIVRVKDSDKAVAVSIANSVSGQFSKHISRLQEVQLIKSTEILNLQLELEKVTLDEALNELKILLSKSRDSSAIQNQIDVNVMTLNLYASKYETLDSTYEDTKFELEESITHSQALIIAYNELLLNIDETFSVDKSILDDTFLTQLSYNVSSSLKEIMKLKIADEEMNPVFIDTLTKLIDEEVNIISSEATLESIKRVYDHDKTNLLANIDKYEKSIDALRSEFATKSLEERMIQRKVDTSQQTYDAFTDKLELTRVAEAAKIAENNIVVVSSAIEPSKPIAPRKGLNLVLGGILGLIVGVTVAFFREYWISSKPE